MSSLLNLLHYQRFTVDNERALSGSTFLGSLNVSFTVNPSLNRTQIKSQILRVKFKNTSFLFK